MTLEAYLDDMGILACNENLTSDPECTLRSILGRSLSQAEVERFLHVV